jgi:tetratricopeptide (TPR) repeat protein
MVAALQLARTADTAAMIDMVYLLARGRYFDANGHTPETLPLLDEAISLVESRDGTADEVLHWLYSKRGNEYINWGDSERGIECYEKALELASPDDAYRRAVGLSVIGRVLAEHNSPAEVDDYLERARQAAESVEEDREYAISFVLQQQSVAAHALGDNEVALRAISEAIRLSAPIAEQSPDTFGRYLMNRASYDLELAQERVRREYQRVLEMAEKAGNLNLQADAHFALGLDYHGMYKFREKAREHLLEARRLFRKVGAVVLESEVEGIIKRYGYDAPN